MRTPERAQKPFWILLQWVSTAYLWTQWLIQDFANIYIYLPRQLNETQAAGSIGIVLVLLLITFLVKGGPVQKILRSKTGVTDIRSATFIDFTYASVLWFFFTLNSTPMSTTWAFLGLIAGREFAIATIDRVRPFNGTLRIVATDAAKAAFGLVVAVTLAVGLPRLAQWIEAHPGWAG